MELDFRPMLAKEKKNQKKIIVFVWIWSDSSSTLEL